MLNDRNRAPNRDKVLGTDRDEFAEHVDSLPSTNNTATSSSSLEMLEEKSYQSNTDSDIFASKVIKERPYQPNMTQINAFDVLRRPEYRL